MLAKAEDEKLRAKYRSWPENIDQDSYFAGSLSLDPAEVAKIWSLLSRDTFAMEVASYPSTFHMALMATLAKRNPHE